MLKAKSTAIKTMLLNGTFTKNSSLFSLWFTRKFYN